MGGGGLIQLVAIGAQDIYITGQPQITFFKSVYRRHTNFAIEPVLQNISGNPRFGEKISITILKNGDLLKNLWVQYSPLDVLPGMPSHYGRHGWSKCRTCDIGFRRTGDRWSTY